MAHQATHPFSASSEEAQEAPPGLFRFTVERYHKAAEAGLFEGRRVELIRATVYDYDPILGESMRLEDMGVAPFRFTVEQYNKAAEAGIFDGQRVELIEGVVIVMSPSDASHGRAIAHLIRMFAQIFLERKATFWIQSPVPMTNTSEPEPDFALVDPRLLDIDRKPSPQETWLAVEVSRTSLAYDRNVKLPLYARSGVREVWIVNLAREVVEVYRDPVAEEERYATSFTAGRGETVAALSFPEVAVAVGDVFGPTQKIEE